jgi:hypothetical protein
MMLPLDDPLWRKLDDAYRDRNIPELLTKLSDAWDGEVAGKRHASLTPSLSPA